MTTNKLCLKKPRKPIMPLKTLDIIFRRRYVQNTQFYFTNRKHALTTTEESQTTKKSSRSFCMPRTEKLMSYIKYRDRMEKLRFLKSLAQPVHLKGSVKMADVKDISRRLYVEEPPDDVKTVVAIHPEFYTVIEGRSIRSFDDIKVYTTNIRNYAMLRQQIGYRKDLIAKIEKNIHEESADYEFISNRIKRHLKDFQKFLTEDYLKASAKVAKAEKVNADVTAINIQINTYNSNMTVLRNILLKLDAIRNGLKVYRSYCLFVAPLFWRQIYDETLRGRVQSIQFESGQFKKNDDLEESMDIENTMAQAKAELQDPKPPVMYFKTPDEMLYLFRTMELQSREYLLQLSKMYLPHHNLQEKIRQLKMSTVTETDYFQWYINSIDQRLQREYHNEKHLQEKFYRILNETFYETIVSEDTLKLKICVEFVYEQVLDKSEEGYPNIRDPMKILEILYEDYNLRLDALDFQIVKVARNEFFAHDLKMMKNAFHAQRVLKEFGEMSRAIYKVFDPPAKFTRPVFTKFKDQKALKAKAKADKEKEKLPNSRPTRVKYKITDEEREGLTFFTEWCEGMNPAPFLKDYNANIKPFLK